MASEFTSPVSALRSRRRRCVLAILAVTFLAVSWSKAARPGHWFAFDSRVGPGERIAEATAARTAQHESGFVPQRHRGPVWFRPARLHPDGMRHALFVARLDAVLTPKAARE